MTYYPKPGDRYCSGVDCNDKYMIPNCTCPPDNVIRHLGKIGCKAQHPKYKNCFKNQKERINNGG